MSLGRSYSTPNSCSDQADRALPSADARQRILWSKGPVSDASISFSSVFRRVCARSPDRNQESQVSRVRLGGSDDFRMPADDRTELPETGSTLPARVRSPKNREGWEQFVLIYRPAITAWSADEAYVRSGLLTLLWGKFCLEDGSSSSASVQR
jgi:hypothetical protein